MAQVLAPKALGRVGVFPVGCTFTPSISPLAVLPLVSTYCSPCPMACRCTLVWGSLSKTSLAVMGAGVARVPLSVCPLPWPLSLSGAILGTGWGCCPALPWQGSHQFGNLLPQFCGALPRVSGHSSPCLALTLSRISYSHFLPCGQQPLTENKKSWGCCRET